MSTAVSIEWTQILCIDLGRSGSAHNDAFVDPPGEDAQGSEAFEGCLLAPVGSMFVCCLIADAGKAPFGERSKGTVPAPDRQIGRVAGQPQVDLPRPGPVCKDLIHQINVEDIRTSDLGLGVGVDGIGCDVDRLAVVLALPERPGCVPDPRVELVSTQARSVWYEVGRPLVHVVENAQPAMDQVAGHGFARPQIKVDLLGELGIEGTQDLLDRRLGSVELLPELIVAKDIAWELALFVAQDELVEFLKALAHPLPIHGKTVERPSELWRAILSGLGMAS